MDNFQNNLITTNNKNNNLINNMDDNSGLNIKLNNLSNNNINNFEFLTTQIISTNDFVAIPNLNGDSFIIVNHKQAHRIQIRREQRKNINIKLNKSKDNKNKTKNNSKDQENNESLSNNIMEYINDSDQLKDFYNDSNYKNKNKDKENNNIINKKIDFIHKSRHDHACRRKRNKSGRFLSKKEQEDLKSNSEDN